MLTGPQTDHRTNTPAYKQARVHMEVIERSDKTPLPRTNPRFKKRHPQNGVEVERKWRRSDYVPLTEENKGVTVGG